jgi:hypothetical protein
MRRIILLVARGDVAGATGTTPGNRPHASDVSVRKTGAGDVAASSSGWCLPAVL